MNTEQAIKLFSDILEDKGQIKNLRYINPKHIECAIEALCEKAVRSKGCDWCQQKHNRYLFTQIADLNAETPIACPWCGKRLEVEHE